MQHCRAVVAVLTHLTLGSNHRICTIKVEAPIPEGVPFLDPTVCTIPVYSLHNSCESLDKFLPMLL